MTTVQTVSQRGTRRIVVYDEAHEGGKDKLVRVESHATEFGTLNMRIKMTEPMVRRTYLYPHCFQSICLEARHVLISEQRVEPACPRYVPCAHHNMRKRKALGCWSSSRASTKNHGDMWNTCVLHDTVTFLDCPPAVPIKQLLVLHRIAEERPPRVFDYF